MAYFIAFVVWMVLGVVFGWLFGQCAQVGQ
jgi:hypothetical protein